MRIMTIRFMGESSSGKGTLVQLFMVSSASSIVTPEKSTNSISRSSLSITY